MPGLKQQVSTQILTWDSAEWPRIRMSQFVEGLVVLRANVVDSK